MKNVRTGLLKVLTCALISVLTALVIVNFPVAQVSAEITKKTASTTSEFLAIAEELTSSSDVEISLCGEVTLEESLALKGKVKITAQEKRRIILQGDAFLDVKNGADVTFENISILQKAENTAKYTLLFRDNPQQGKAYFYGCDITTEKTDTPLFKATSGNGNFYLDDTSLVGGTYSVENGNLMVSGNSSFSAVGNSTMVYDFRSAKVLEKKENNRVGFILEEKPFRYKGGTPDAKENFDVDIYYTLDGSNPAISDTRILYKENETVSLIVDRHINVALVGRGIVYQCGYEQFIYDVNEDKTPATLKAVKPIEGREYRCGTELTAEDFPEAVEIELSDGRNIFALADWDLTTLDAYTEGTYTVYGALTLPYFVSDDAGLEAKIQVTVYYAELGNFVFTPADPLQETKNTATKGYTAGTFTCEGGDEQNYVYSLPEGTVHNKYFTVEDNELKLATDLKAGTYEVRVKVESVGKTLEEVITLTVAEKSYKKVIYGNPYEDIDWDTVNFVMTSTHSHTFYSSGNFEESEHNDVASDTVSERVALYKSYGYGAVIITEHDYVALEREGGKYADESILCLYGNEMSKAYHTLFYGLVPYYDRKGEGSGQTNGVPGNLANIRALNGKGLSYFAHPYRSSKDNDYWLGLFNDYRDVVYGMEVFNAGQASRNYSEPLWDYILTRTMPERAIWGSASDDAHSNGAAGTGWQVLLLRDDEMNMEGVYNALKNGNTFLSTICVDPTKDENRRFTDLTTPTPYFTSIRVDEEKGTVTATAEYYDRIEWVSADGKVVAKGETIDLNATYGVDKYVRCRIYGVGGMSHSQPIGVKDGTEIYEGKPSEVLPENPPVEPSDPNSSKESNSQTGGSAVKTGCGGAIATAPQMLALLAAIFAFVKKKSV